MDVTLACPSTMQTSTLHRDSLSDCNHKLTIPEITELLSTFVLEQKAAA